MCSCLHLFKFQAGSGVVIKPASSPLLSPEHMHTSLWLLYSDIRASMGNAQSDLSNSFGSCNMLLSNKEKKSPSSAEGKMRSLIFALLWHVWIICIVTTGLINYRITSAISYQKCQSLMHHACNALHALHIIMGTSWTHTRGWTPIWYYFKGCN